MFNVSALLLDDALKPATPLTNDAIDETLRYTLDKNGANFLATLYVTPLLLLLLL